jgi:hypothetical protein
MARDKRHKKTNQEDDKVLAFDSHESEKPQKEGTYGHLLGWVVVILLIAAIAVGAYLVLFRQTSYNDYEVLSEAQSNDSTRMTYLSYNNSLIKYSQEGITYLDKNGQAVWVESYKMKQPVAAVSGEYVAVADLNGNDVYVFNTNGKVNSMEMPYTICNIDVASQGVFVVVLENETENYIEIYDKNGQQIAELRTTIADSGYPMDISLSDDGTKLATSYITVNGVTVENSIATYNFGDVGQNTTDRLVGGFNNLDDTLVPEIEFLSNDIICAFGDDQFLIYSMKEKPSEKAVISDFQGEVQSIFYNSKYIGIVERGNTGLTKDSDSEDSSLYTIKVYDTSGNRKFSIPLECSYSNIYATESEIIVVGTSECRIYDFNGNKKFAYSFSKEVKNLVPTGSQQQYIVVFDDSTEMIKLRYTKEDAEEVQ